MIRDVEKLKNGEYDVVIVGGGIYGAAAFREAVLCGFNCALIDAGDFCGATSANSLKIIHGGLRYLQKFDIPRVRESVRERRNMMRIASHLVHPLPCMMPTRGIGMKGRPALFAGLALNELLSSDRNCLQDQEKRIPMGRLVSRKKCLEKAAGIDAKGVTGAAVWYDACAYNTERLVVSMVQSGVEQGGAAANYVRMTGFLMSGDTVEGIKARDEVSGEEFEIKAKLVVNNTGPWVNETLGLMDREVTKPLKGLSMGMNFVLKKKLFSDFAVGLACPKETNSKERLLFFVPWQGTTMVGTYYRSHEGRPGDMKVTDEDIDLFLKDLNAAYKAGNLDRDDIAFLHAGVLPTVRETHGERDPKLADHYSIIDHAVEDDLKGLVSVLGVKYTTARDVAEKTVKVISEKLDVKPVRSRSDESSLPGADIKDFNGLLAHAELHQISSRLVFNYGTEYKAIADDSESPDNTLSAEIRFLIKDEMPMTLSDLIYRRSDLAFAVKTRDKLLEHCASLMAEETGWDESRTRAEIDKARTVQFPGSEFFKASQG